MYYFYARYTDPVTGEVLAGGMPMATEQNEGSLDLNIRMAKE